MIDRLYFSKAKYINFEEFVRVNHWLLLVREGNWIDSGTPQSRVVSYFENWLTSAGIIVKIQVGVD